MVSHLWLNIQQLQSLNIPPKMNFFILTFVLFAVNLGYAHRSVPHLFNHHGAIHLEDLTKRTVMPDNICGGANGYSCPTASQKCCSEYGMYCSGSLRGRAMILIYSCLLGWCGDTDAYCGNGCQLEFGTCSSSPSSTPSSLLQSESTIQNLVVAATVKAREEETKTCTQNQGPTAPRTTAVVTTTRRTRWTRKSRTRSSAKKATATTRDAEPGTTVVVTTLHTTITTSECSSGGSSVYETKTVGCVTMPETASVYRQLGW